jgi:hypothetical protein
MSICCNNMFHAFQIYVAYVSSGCCKIRSSVAYVAMTMHLCCKVYVSTVSAVSNVCCKCFIRTLYALHWLYTYIASVYFKWFKRMLQMFYECCICCSAHTLQEYVVNVLSVLDVCCSKCFLHCKCFTRRHGKGAQRFSRFAQEAKRVRQQARSTKLHLWAWQQAWKHEAASMDRQ